MSHALKIVLIANVVFVMVVNLVSYLIVAELFPFIRYSKEYGYYEKETPLGYFGAICLGITIALTLTQFEKSFNHLLLSSGVIVIAMWFIIKATRAMLSGFITIKIGKYKLKVYEIERALDPVPFTAGVV